MRRLTMLAVLAPSLAMSQSAIQITSTAESQSALEASRVWAGNAERGRVEAVIATKELSRIALDGGRLAALIDYRQALHARKDEATGQFFIAPREDGSKPINLFAIDEAGATYALLLHPRDVPAQSVLLKPAIAPTSERRARAPSLARAIKDIVLALAKPTHLDDPRVTRASEEIALWAETRFVLTATLAAGDLIGERYLLTNLTKAELRLREEEFYREGAVAVSITQHALPPGAPTAVIVVRERATRP